jgi:hypothetical protein
VAFSYDAAQTSTAALAFVRFLVRDTRKDRAQLEDEEITTLLGLRGILATDAPSTNPSGCYLAAAEAAENLQARYAADSSIALTAEGPVKSLAASAYAQLAKALRARAQGAPMVSFEPPRRHSPTAVAGIWLPDLDPCFSTLDGLWAGGWFE